MPHSFYESLEENEYFQSLPACVRQTIYQSGMHIADEAQLRRCAEALLEPDPTMGKADPYHRKQN